MATRRRSLRSLTRGRLAGGDIGGRGVGRRRLGRGQRRLPEQGSLSRRPRSLAPAALQQYSRVAPVVLRVVVGVIMAYHGWQKLQNGPDMFAAGVLDPKGVPFPDFMAWVVALSELVGGSMLVVGFLTRLATLPLLGVLIGAIVLVKKDVGLIAPPGTGAGMELDLALIAGLIAVLLLGPGRPSVDHRLSLE